ncbi:MAG TPA: FAD-dependent oxidoreductase [Pyrinomonadaceae bacterium]|jgi:NADPH-dependent 2,4-dienoyl-CoA reductase/sulfur reductase-like enzyme/nitrite reductase/ring-hydroxylating ferredoxin subunit|nr:FAD-dependent oxidoreductase [Pyrinomonadaceae bacterium]
MSLEEVIVAKNDEFADGEMKQVTANGTEVLLARVGGKFHAVAAYCPHYGAPLVDGVLSGDRVVCPWHHSCFDITTGDLLEPPALDSLPSSEIKIENDQVIVRVPDGGPDRRTPTMSKRNPNDTRLFAIVGGGAAGYAAVQTLREDGFAGRLVLITAEDRLPYDRPNLSKDYLQGDAEPAWMPLRPEDFFAEYDIEVERGRRVQSIDASQRSIDFEDGGSLLFDAVLVATGGQPVKLPFQLESQENVFPLRSFDDSDAIIAAAEKAKRAVVIGASFIGMEVASSLAARGLEVTVVAPGDVPFQKILGEKIGRIFQNVHVENGVKFELGSSVAGFIGERRVTAVTLADGKRLDADFVVVGVGVKPVTNMLKGVTLHTDGSVFVDEHLRAADAVYAAGDIAYFPSPLNGKRQRIEHWRTAMQQGRIAAHNMIGRNVPYNVIPFFWTHQFDAGLLYVGHAEQWDEILYQGDASARDFLAFYTKDGRVLAVAGMNRDREMAAIDELMRLAKMPLAAELKSSSVDWVKLLFNQNGR